MPLIGPTTDPTQIAILDLWDAQGGGWYGEVLVE